MHMIVNTYKSYINYEISFVYNNPLFQGSLSVGRFVSIPIAMYVKPPTMLMINLVKTSNVFLLNLTTKTLIASERGSSRYSN